MKIHYTNNIFDVSCGIIRLFEIVRTLVYDTRNKNICDINCSSSHMSAVFFIFDRPFFFFFEVESNFIVSN